MISNLTVVFLLAAFLACSSFAEEVRKGSGTNLLKKLPKGSRAFRHEEDALNKRTASYVSAEEMDYKKPQVYVDIHAFTWIDNTVEWHCVDRTSYPLSVHGTYLNRGYFEGALEWDWATPTLTGYVSYWELTPDGDTFTPTSGAAVITYNTSFANAHGRSWAAGQTNMPASPLQDWGYLQSCEHCWDGVHWDGMSLEEQIKFIRGKCLWSPFDRFHEPVAHNLNNQIFGPEGFENTWSNDGVGPADTDGSTVGAYVYTYSKKECASFEPEFSCRDGNVELGHYNLNAISANVGNNRVFVSLWNATTGPLAGQAGTIFGLFQSNVAVGTNFHMDRSEFNGIFCYFDNSGYNIEVTNCSPQISRRTKRDRSKSDYLISAYDAYLGNTRSPLYYLKWLANKIWH